MNSTGSDELLSAEELAQLFGIEAKQITTWYRQGRLTATRTLTGQRKYRRRDVGRLLQGLPVEPIERAAAPEPPPPPAPTFPQARRRARRRALELLHAADVAESDPRDGLGDDEDPFVRTLVEGVVDRKGEIDEIIGASAEHWPIGRMPVVDRNLLRIAIFELLGTKTPLGPVVDEAVSLAKLLSTEESGRFVNAVLGRIAREHERAPRA